MRRGLRIALALGVLVALFAVLRVVSGTTRLIHAVLDAEPQPAGVEPASASPARANMRAPAAPLPETFANTEIDGGFQLDARGQLVPSEGALRLFNYFFSASGRESEAQIVARIQAEIRRRLRPPADAQALALLDDYVAYRHAGRALSDDLEDATPEERVKALYALRRARFGAERAARLFERDEAMRDAAMERTRILRDPKLSDAQRELELSAAEAELPEGLRERRAYSTAAARSYESSEALREEGASEAELFEVRRAQLGEDGARRMALVDVEEQAFHAALDELRTIAPDLDGESREAFIAAHFTERDRPRARALLAAGFPSH